MSEEEGSGSDGARVASEEPADSDGNGVEGAQKAPKRKRWPSGLLRGQVSLEYRDTALAKIKSMQDALKRKTDFDSVVGCIGVVGNEVHARVATTEGLRYVDEHVGLGTAMSIARDRAQQDSQRATLQYGPVHRPFADCSINLRRRLVHDGLESMIFNRKGVLPYSEPGGPPPDGAAAQSSMPAAAPQQQRGSEALFHARQRGLAAAETVQRQCSWYPADVPYASALSVPHVHTDTELARLFNAMTGAATPKQMETWLKLLRSMKHSNRSELDKLYMAGALHHQQQQQSSRAAASDMLQISGPRAGDDAGQAAGVLALNGSDHALACVPEDGALGFLLGAMCECCKYLLPFGQAGHSASVNRRDLN